MIPVLLAVGMSAVLVRVLNITLSPLTTVSGPLVVATCAEFSVLLVDRYAEQRARGFDPEESNRVAAERTGRAFFTSALTTLGGFAVLMFSSLPLLADFGMVVTINIAVALLAALVVVPPLVKEFDHRRLLVMGPQHRVVNATRRKVAMALTSAVLVAGGLVLVLRATSTTSEAAVEPQMTETAEQPATTPPSTTTPPTTSLAPDSTLPPGPAERPTGLVAGVFYDGLVAAGVDPGMARCAADDLIATTSEADLLAMGIASVPRPAEVNALLDGAAKRCGVTQEQLDAAAAAPAADSGLVVALLAQELLELGGEVVAGGHRGLHARGRSRARASPRTPPPGRPRRRPRRAGCATAWRPRSSSAWPVGTPSTCSRWRSSAADDCGCLALPR